VPDDADWVARARDGDGDAFAHLVASHADAARRTAVQYGAGDDTDDLVQDVLVKAFRRLSEYRGDAPFRSWLLSIVANEARNLHRSRRRREEAGARLARANPAPPAADSALESALAAERQRELIAAVRGLSAVEREVIAHRFLLDRSEAETAAHLDVPVGTVKSRTSRALARLRTRMGVAIAVAVAAAVIAVVPNSRTAVADVVSTILRFAGVEIHTTGSEHNHGVAPTTVAPLPSARPVSLDDARRLTQFAIGVPAALGAPEAVWVSDLTADGSPRVVSLLYRGGALRIDEYDGRFDLAFVKTAHDVTYLDVNGSPALWIGGPHQLSYVDSVGLVHPTTARQAGPTLLWQNGAVAYRIEGPPTSADAAALASSIAG
jgi:RNA polymerase sigma factor (sigma-70 family)